ncbi:MAG: prepilin-type N-terminal cleavage/methylation domain-containing protein [Terriglobales bacterium]
MTRQPARFNRRSAAAWGGTTRPLGRRRGSAGFSLLEVIIASLVLTVGLLTLAYGYGQGLQLVSATQDEAIAQQKAREAIEAVLTARNDQEVTYSQVANVSDGGIFVDGFTQLTTFGPDGLPNTADDGAVEQIVEPGPDGILGDADDVKLTLNQFQREITITDLSPTLRQVVVTVDYTTGNGATRSVSLETYVSAYS